MQNITFDFPTRVFLGKKVFSRVGRVLSLATHRRILIVAGQGAVRDNGVHQTIVNSLEKNDIFWTDYWGVSPNPDSEHVRGIIRSARDFNAGALLAVGGGSVIDAAKIAAAALYAQQDPWEMVAARKEVLDAVPCYAVCTCSGAGAEASCSAILSNTLIQKKHGIKGPGLWPRAAFVDPRAQFGLPWLQTLAGGLDAFSHCLEHFVSGALDPRPFELSLMLCSGMMRGILDALRTLQKNPEIYTARASLAWASILALNGVAGSGLGGGNWTLHLAAHALGAHFPRIPHGLAVGALLPSWLEVLSKESPHVFTLLESSLQGACGPSASLQSFRQLNEVLSCPNLRDFGVTTEDIAFVAATAYADALAHPGAQRFFSLSEHFFRDLLSRSL